MLGSIIVGLIVVLIVVAAVRSLHKSVKNGGTIQCGDCPSAGACHGGCQKSPTPEQRKWINTYSSRKHKAN